MRAVGAPSAKVALAAGAAMVVGLIAGIVYLAGVADRTEPERREVRIELPDAFKK